MSFKVKSLDFNDTSNHIAKYLKQRTQYQDDEFIPFTNERDSLGRLLTKTPRETETSILPKIKTPNSLLSKIYQDSKSTNSMNAILSTPSSLTSIESNIAFESSTWKAQKIKSNADYKEEPVNIQKPKNQKISKSRFRSMIAHHRSLSSKILWPPSKQDIDQKPCNDIIAKLEKELLAEDDGPSFKELDQKKVLMLPCTPQKKMRRLKPILKEREGNNTLKKPEIKINRIEDKRDEVDVELDAIDNKKMNVGVQDSAGQIVRGKSHFKQLKTEDCKEKYLMEQRAFQESISNMKSRLRILQSEIGINLDY